MTLRLGNCTACTKVLDCMKSWINPKNFKASRLRGIIMGVTIGATLGEVCAYKLVQQDIRAGHLPAYAIDVAIIFLAFFEVLVAPVISWWGYRNRRQLLISYVSAGVVALISWFFLPAQGDRAESAFCDAANASNNSTFVGVSALTVARLVMVSLSSVTFVVSRVACWTHGLAYCDEFAPDRTSVHYALVLLTRAVPMILGYRVFTGDVDTNMMFQTAIMTVGFTPNLVQLFLVVPKAAPVVNGIQKTALPHEHRSFLTSVSRVCSKPLAVSQIFAMGLLSAALFGYMYNEIAVVKVKFNLVPDRNGKVNLADLFQYIFVMFVVGFAGNLYAKPISKEFRSAAIMKQIIRSTIFVIFFYVAITIWIRCDHGLVAGLSNDIYTNPECSVPCHCKPRMREYEPVCVVDDLVTYVSPCQAGCGAQELVQGVRAYSNCTCSASGRALAGACSDALCAHGYRLHSMLLIVIVTFTLLTFHAQGVLLIRTVDPRDKSVVLGIAWSMVTLMTFVCGYLLFMAIRAGTCRWFEGEQCHLHTSSFPYHIGGTCAFLALVSLLISAVSVIFIRRTDKNIENTRL